jgi:hypothetical protein
MVSKIGEVLPTVVAVLQERSTKASTSLDKEIAHKRHFLTVFRRWEALFKRADRGDIQADKWFIAEYYKSLGHLSQNGLEALTEELKERCTFFPTIKECLAIIRPSRFDYANPFYRLAHFPEGDPPMLETPLSNIKQLSHKDAEA